MGRRRIATPEAYILDKRSQGASIKEISQELGISTATLSRRIAELEHKHGILTKYRELQGLQLTGLQLRILGAIDSYDLGKASLSELLTCFHILKKAEMVITKQHSPRVSGLLNYLEELQKQTTS